jgi:hypothetical protein
MCGRSRRARPDVRVRHGEWTQGRDCGPAQIQRIAENAARRPDMNLAVEYVAAPRTDAFHQMRYDGDRCARPIQIESHWRDSPQPRDVVHGADRGAELRRVKLLPLIWF